MLDSTWVTQQSNPDCFQFRVAFTILLYNHTHLGVPPSICLFQYTLSVFCCLPAHSLLIALSATWHTSAFLSIQLKDTYLHSEYPLSRATMNCPPNGLVLLSRCAKSIQFSSFMSAHIDVCFSCLTSAQLHDLIAPSATQHIAAFLSVFLKDISFSLNSTHWSQMVHLEYR